MICAAAAVRVNVFGLLMERSGVRIAVARAFHAAECAAASASFKGWYISSVPVSKQASLLAVF